MNHSEYMLRCFQLAQTGAGYVAPNPMVGAVLVYDQKIVSEGFHQRFGEAHAEVIALRNFPDDQIIEKSTLYVNLEPCSHTGKTPPCTDLIIAKKIKHVVISNRDPFPLVNGKGMEKLVKAGIKVTSGIHEQEGAFLNRRFFTFHNRKRPFVILKWAQTRNGYMAPAIEINKKKGVTWITNQASRLMVHQWRSQEQAILVGQATVLTDNPRLDVRGIPGNNPIRVIIDPQLAIDSSFHIHNNSSPTLIFNHLKDSQNKNISLIKIEPGPEFIGTLLHHLFTRNIQSVLVEGGALTIQNFMDANCWDEARVFTGQVEFNEGLHAPVPDGRLTDHVDVSGDILTVYSNPASS